MLLFTEGFNELHPSYYKNIFGFAYYANHGYGNNVPAHPFAIPNGTLVQTPSFPSLQSVGMRAGYAVEMTASNINVQWRSLVYRSYLRPCIFKPSRRVIVGFALAPQFQSYGVNHDQRGFSQFGASPTNIPYHEGDAFLDVFFCSNSDANFIPVPNSVFRDPNEYRLFALRIYFAHNGYIYARFHADADFLTGYDNLATLQYVNAPRSDLIPLDMTDGFNYFEVYVDSVGAVNNQGNAKLAINGKTVYTANNITTSAYNLWGSDLNNPHSKFNSVHFRFNSLRKYDGEGTWEASIALLDDIYIANEDGGIHDDFLGPIHISQSFPQTQIFAGFEGIDNNAVVQDRNIDLINDFFSGTDNTFIQAAQSHTYDEYVYDLSLVPYEADIIAVTQRSIIMGDPATPNDYSPNTIAVTIRTAESGVVAQVGNEGISIPNVINIMDVIYGYHPLNTTIWSRGLVHDAVFGIMNFENVFENVVAGLGATCTYITGGHEFLPTDGDMNTYAQAVTAAACTLMYQLPDEKYIRGVEIYASDTRFIGVFTVQVSIDGGRWYTLSASAILKMHPTVPNCGMWRYMNSLPRRMKYIKITGTGGTLQRIYDINVLGLKRV